MDRSTRAGVARPSKRRDDAVVGGRTMVAIWMLGVLMALGALGGLWAAVAGTQAPSSETFVAHNRARLERLAPGAASSEGATSEQARIVLFGSSRLRFATESDDRLGDQISSRSGVPTTVLRIVNNRATFADFEPLADAILAADPTMVVFEERLLVRNPTGFQDLGTRREYLLWRLVGGGPWDPGQLDQVALQEDNDCFDGTKEAARELLVERREAKWDRWLDFDPTGPSAVAFRDFLDELADAGIEARLLQFPDTSAGAALLARYDTEDTAGADTAWATPVLAPGFRIPDEHYCDLIHLDEPGRTQYSAWLVEALAADLDLLLD